MLDLYNRHTQLTGAISPVSSDAGLDAQPDEIRPSTTIQRRSLQNVCSPYHAMGCSGAPSNSQQMHWCTAASHPIKRLSAQPGEAEVVESRTVERLLLTATRAFTIWEYHCTCPAPYIHHLRVGFQRPCAATPPTELAWVSKPAVFIGASPRLYTAFRYHRRRRRSPFFRSVRGDDGLSTSYCSAQSGASRGTVLLMPVELGIVPCSREERRPACSPAHNPLRQDSRRSGFGLEFIRQLLGLWSTFATPDCQSVTALRWIHAQVSVEGTTGRRGFRRPDQKRYTFHSSTNRE
ncbi:hypothetical protein R3P38DRAFT_2877172 [Favolaschia claudopus]|uniref:Uncharacterized protein n=1 Tax=Favolaschia claudopus TaxID=2862362 RepID=A0AAW0D7L8_9AGAR